MSDQPSSRRRVNLSDLNWLGKTVFVGGTLMRLTANLVDATADRVTSIAEQTKEAYDRERDPNIEDARVLEEYSDADSSSEP